MIEEVSFFDSLIEMNPFFWYQSHAFKQPKYCDGKLP